MKQFEERRNALMRWTADKGDADRVEAIDLAPWILAATELMDDLLAEVKRLREQRGRMNKQFDQLTDHWRD